LIESIMTGENQMVGLLTNIGGSNISILMNFNDFELMKRKLEFLKEQINEKSDQLYWIGVGNVYENLNQINQSYKEACMSLEYRQLNLETQILYYADCLGIINQQMILISVEEENQLMWSILAGDQKKVSEYLTLLFGKIHEQTSFTQLRQFGHNILGLVYNLILQNQLQKTEILAGGYDFFAVNDKFTFNELKDYLQKTCYRICEYFNARVAIRDKKLEDDIIAYIYQNYNLDLSLDFIAAKFNMNPKYLSRFFKEHFGVNFLEFINQFRVKKAKELLVQEPNLKINVIADQVGISNVNTFIAVFKKYEGVTPGKYRNMQNSNVG
ncbi:MAG: transcriptional regulator, AraC family, partial [Bacilli bacterium]|nr:transcriptional regulator, AraC family [Bacilli bacterium]